MRKLVISLACLAALPATAAALSTPAPPVTPDQQAVTRLGTQLDRVATFVTALTNCRENACFARRGASLVKAGSQGLAKTATLETVATTPCVQRAIRFERHWIATTVNVGRAARYRTDPKTRTRFVNLRQVNRFLRFSGQAAVNAQRVIAACPEAMSLSTVR
jgi:hypothetical protein